MKLWNISRKIPNKTFMVLVVVIIMIKSLEADDLDLRESRSINSQLNRKGFTQIRRGKYAVFKYNFNREFTFSSALKACKSQLRGASLFVIKNAADSKWFGKEINRIKNNVNGASKFWIGLKSRGAGGPLRWLDGSKFKRFREIKDVDGFDDREKKFAFAVPDSGSRVKIEFNENSDRGEAYACQYVK